jgi:hypothetical protein
MPEMFTVEIALRGGVTYLVPLKTALDEWIREHDGDTGALPAVKLESGQPSDALRLRLTWIEVAAENAWGEMTSAVAILAARCPPLVSETVALTVSAEIRHPRPDYHRPRGA